MNNEKSHPHSSTADETLEKAVEHLRQAERDLKAAHELEEAAEKKIHEAEAEIEDALEGHRDDVLVHVTHVNDLESTEFKLSIHATLQAVLDEAYEKLEIKPQPKDVFQTASEHPVSLMSHLTLTLEEAHKRGVIKDFRFQIVSETGGA
jgi:hypothetical protein